MPTVKSLSQESKGWDCITRLYFSERLKNVLRVCPFAVLSIVGWRVKSPARRRLRDPSQVLSTLRFVDVWSPTARRRSVRADTSSSCSLRAFRTLLVATLFANNTWPRARPHQQTHKQPRGGAKLPFGGILSTSSSALSLHPAKTLPHARLHNHAD